MHCLSGMWAVKMNSDPMFQFLISGDAHAYYALIGILILSVAVIFGGDIRYVSVIALLASGVFADIWAHGYQH